MIIVRDFSTKMSLKDFLYDQKLSIQLYTVKRNIRDLSELLSLNAHPNVIFMSHLHSIVLQDNCQNIGL